MIADDHQTGGGGFATIERWPDALGDLHARVAGRFRRPEVRQGVYRYLAGLLGRVERKNGWQVAGRSKGQFPRASLDVLTSLIVYCPLAIRRFIGSLEMSSRLSPSLFSLSLHISLHPT